MNEIMQLVSQKNGIVPVEESKLTAHFGMFWFSEFRFKENNKIHSNRILLHKCLCSNEVYIDEMIPLISGRFDFNTPIEKIINNTLTLFGTIKILIQNRNLMNFQSKVIL